MGYREKKGAAAYQLGNTSSPMITEIKQHLAWLILGYETVPSVVCVLLLTLKMSARFD